jgi:hypothetical protein
MEIVLKAYMESNGFNGYMAWIDAPKFKMLVQGDSPEETTKSLVNSVKVAIAFNLGMGTISEIEHKETANGDYIINWSRQLAETGNGEFKFAFNPSIPQTA